MNITASKKRIVSATPIFDQLSREYSRAGTIKVFYSRKNDSIRIIHPLIRK